MKEYFSQVEAARFLGYSKHTLLRAEKRGLLRAEGTGKAKRYRRTELERLPALLGDETVRDRGRP